MLEAFSTAAKGYLPAGSYTHFWFSFTVNSKRWTEILKLNFTTGYLDHPDLDLGLTTKTDLQTVVKVMASPDSGLIVRDRMWLKITIPNAFIGRKNFFHSWLILLSIRKALFSVPLNGDKLAYNSNSRSFSSPDMKAKVFVPEMAWKKWIEMGHLRNFENESMCQVLVLLWSWSFL